MGGPPWLQAFSRVAALAVLGWSGVGAAQSASDPLVRQYFVRQDADEAVLIRINPFGAEFESRVYAPERVPVATSRVPHSRLAPVFQFVHASSVPRQLDIEVNSTRHTDRARFELELTRLSVRDERSATLVRAYQLLSYGLQAEANIGVATWPVKVGSLVSAADVFGRFGMEELRLWSTYFAAHFAHHGLHDFNAVLDFTGQILDAMQIPRFPEVELAARLLYSEALIALWSNGASPTAGVDADAILAALAAGTALAKRLDRPFERAWSIARSAEIYAQRGQTARALERFHQARELADSLGAGDLATEVRERIVQIHEAAGDVIASGEVLQEIESQLANAGAGEELALNLLRQGRLFNATFRYPDAVRVLTQALEHQRNTATLSRIRLALGEAHYESGQFDAALAALEPVLVDPASDAIREPNPLLDSVPALRMLANIYRHQGAFASMHEARAAQGRHAGTAEASWLYERGVDALADRSRGRAAEWFERSLSSASGSSRERLRALALLRLCLATAGSDLERADCARATVQGAYLALRKPGNPRQACEAAFLWAQFLRATGAVGEADEAMEGLIGDMHFYRHALPGVLGAWYWLNQGQVIATAMDWALSAPGDAAASLLTFGRIRQVRAADGAVTGEDDARDAVRRFLAQLEPGDGATAGGAAQDALRAALADLRRSHHETSRYPSAEAMRVSLHGLEDSEAVLTWYFGPDSAVAWVARSEGIRRVRLPDPAAARNAIERARAGAESADGAGFDRLMQRAGELLLAPVAGSLAETVYLLVPPELAGLPLDALRVGGRYLAERHGVVYLGSFPRPSPPADLLRHDTPTGVFLAGHPVDDSGEFAASPRTSMEIAAVADRFVGPGLHIVQGSALLPDEFEDPRYAAADLLHLSMPGVIDADRPERSWLELSEFRRGGGRARLRASDIREFNMRARLVFLSQTRFIGRPRPDRAAPPALVADFQAAGAPAVIASLWPVPDEIAARQAADFYQWLAETGDVAESLYAAKRRWLAGEAATDSRDWARLQLYID